MEEEREEKKEKVPYWQVFYDSVFLLLFLSMTISAATYIIWGLMEISNVRPFPGLKP